MVFNSSIHKTSNRLPGGIPKTCSYFCQISPMLSVLSPIMLSLNFWHGFMWGTLQKSIRFAFKSAPCCSGGADNYLKPSLWTEFYLALASVIINSWMCSLLFKLRREGKSGDCVCIQGRNLKHQWWGIYGAPDVFGSKFPTAPAIMVKWWQEL